MAGHDGQKVSLVVAAGDDTQVSARELLRKQLSGIGGGGGDERLAQGGGRASAEQIESFFDDTLAYVATVRKS